MTAVGVIGLGAMGTPIARKLLNAGHQVFVFARRPEAMAPLLAEGAHPASSPAELAAHCEVTVTMVLDGRAVEDVVLGPNGIIHGARRGTVHVDHSTIDPETARRVASALSARGVEMLDAPVSGGSAAAAAAELAIMVGGDPAVLERVSPLLRCYGRTITHIGASGAGQVAKACNQISTIVNMLGGAEAMLLAERSGVDPAKVLEVMLAGFGASRMLALQGPKMIAHDFEGRIESRLHHKDIHIVLDLAAALGLELPASKAAAEVWTRLQQRGGARQDSAAVFDVLANSWMPPQGFRHAATLLVSGAVRRLRPDSSASDVQSTLERLAADLAGLALDLHAPPEVADWLVGELDRTIERLPQTFDRRAARTAMREVLTSQWTHQPPENARDLFIVYAPEDRLPVAAPLAVELAKRRVSVAFSEYEVATAQQLADALRDGLARHTAGVVLKTPAFIRLGLSTLNPHERLLVLDHHPHGDQGRSAQTADGLARWVARIRQ